MLLKTHKKTSKKRDQKSSKFFLHYPHIHTDFSHERREGGAPDHGFQHGMQQAISELGDIRITNTQ